MQHNPYAPGGGGYRPPPAQNGNALASLICGCLSPFFPCFLIGVAALWLGAKARKEAQAAGEPSSSSNNTMALIGMIIGGIFGAIWLLYILFYVVMVVFIGGMAVLGA